MLRGCTHNLLLGLRLELLLLPIHRLPGLMLWCLLPRLIRLLRLPSHRGCDRGSCSSECLIRAPPAPLHRLLLLRLLLLLIHQQLSNPTARPQPLKVMLQRLLLPCRRTRLCAAGRRPGRRLGADLRIQTGKQLLPGGCGRDALLCGGAWAQLRERRHERLSAAGVLSSSGGWG